MKLGQKVKRIARVFRESLRSPEFEHVLTALSLDPMGRVMREVAVTVAHVYVGRTTARFCSVCFDLKPFDAPLC